MRYLIFWLLFCASSLEASEPMVAGEWSAPTNGLRGRLVCSEVKAVNGTRIAHLYLELENVSDTLSPLLIDSHTPKLEVTDATGKAVPQSPPTVIEVMEPLPYTLVLPNEATLRLRISLSGWNIWIISNGSGEERDLAGSFAIAELKPLDVEGLRKDHQRGMVWRGTLNLPKLKLPTSAK